MNQTIKEKIRQRRRQILVHSYIYYELNQNIVSDEKWSRWAKELEKLQNDYPNEARCVEYADMFSGWDGSSGAFLIFDDDIKNVAKIILSISDGKSRPKNIKTKIIKSTKKMKKSGAISLF